jgi:hypothetical protein
MKQLVLNDGRSMEVQSVSAAGGVLHVRMILTTSEQLKAYFMDTFATSVMTLYENGKPVDDPYENYTILKYIKEETGGIWEVELRQTEADTNTQLAELKEEVQAAQQATTQTNTDLQMAIAELTMVIATLAVPAAETPQDTEGGEMDV